MDMEEIRKRYDKLRSDAPDDAGERRWYSRLMSWDDFLAFGPDTAKAIRQGTLEDYLLETWPEMADLLRETFLKK